jgi:hypothetical protein
MHLNHSEEIFMPEHGNEQELIQKQNFPVYNQEQIDQLILTPEARATDIIKKVPNMVKEPIYLLDENDEKVPLTNEDGEIIVSEEGEIKYIIKDYKEVQHGWIPVRDIVPASEIFNIDNATSNLSQEAIKVILYEWWMYNHYALKQQLTGKDYSYRLHKLRNDALAVLNSAKSYNNSTVQAIKTFINKTDTKQWMKQDEGDKKKSNPFAAMFGGFAQKKKTNQKPLTAFDPL